MGNKSNSELFCDSFIKRTWNVVANEYSRFAQTAIRDKNLYIEVVKILYSRQKEFSRETWKMLTFEALEKMVEVCSYERTETREGRQELINTIMPLLEDAHIKISAYPEKDMVSGVKYMVLHIIIDVICAYSDKISMIRLSAMVYDMVHRMNQEDREFEYFYGTDAENDIIDYTFKNILILKGNLSADKWIEGIYSQFTMEFARKFCKLLHEKAIQEKEVNRKAEDFENTNNKKRDLITYKEKDRNKTRFAWVQRAVTGCAIVGIVVLAFFTVKIWNESVEKTASQNEEIAALNEVIEGLKIENNKEIESLKTENNEMKDRIHELEELAQNYGHDSLEPTKTTEENLTEPTKIAGENLSTSESEEQGSEANTYTVGSICVLQNARHIRREKNTDTQENILKTVPNGEPFEILEEMDENRWAKVKYEDVEGYMKIP